MSKFGSRMTLLQKGVLLCLLLIVGPMLLMFWYSSEKAAHAIQLQVAGAFYQLNMQNHVTLDRVIDSVDGSMVTMIGNSLIQNFRTDTSSSGLSRVREYVSLERLLSHYSVNVSYSLFLFVDNPADYSFAPSYDIANSGVIFVRDASALPWLRRAVDANGVPGMGIIARFSSRDQQEVALYRAIRSITDDNRIIGVLVATTNFGQLLKADIQAVHLPAGTEVYLTDRAGQTYAGSAPIGSVVSIPPNATRLQDGVYVTGQDMYVTHNSEYYDNRLLYKIPMNSLVGESRNIQGIIQTISLVYLAVLFFFLLYAVRMILRPLTRLSQSVRNFQPGHELAIVPEMTRTDEIGYLYRSVQKMTANINELIRDRYLMEIRQKESELILLHSQITPHLLYNTLDSIYWYGLRGGMPEVAEMVKDLSTLLRIGLSRGKELIRVKEERQHVEAYLQLQEKRYNHSFRYSLEVDADAEEGLVPKVIIQPLVENSIVHGIGKMDGEGEVSVRVYRQRDRLLVEVADNGFRPVNLEKIQAILSGQADPDKGFGIRNVHKRIQLRFGDEFGLAYEVRPGGGALARIRLPWLPGPEGAPRLNGADPEKQGQDQSS